MALDRLAGVPSSTATGLRSQRGTRQPSISSSDAMAVHGVHLLSGTRTSGRFGGAPRRQKTSGSIVSW